MNLVFSGQVYKIGEIEEIAGKRGFTLTRGGMGAVIPGWDDAPEYTSR
jgi:hypothetical protein